MQILLAAAALFVADVPLTIPAEVRGQPGEFLVVKAETPGKDVRWVLLDQGPNLLPPELLRDSKTAVVYCLKPGTYRLLAYTAKGDEPSEPRICRIIIGNQPSPPGPDPKPPGPKPPVPPPVDPLLAKFRDAYAADKSDAAAKKQQVAALTGLYAAMAEHVQEDKTLATTGEVLADLQRTAKAMVLRAEVLVELRKMIAAEISAALGTNPATALDAALRGKASETFNKISKLLEQVK